MQFTRSIRRNQTLRPDVVATRCAGRTRTWAEMADRISRVASALRELGLERDDRVAILALNSDYYMEAMFAVAWAGGVLVPLNTRWSVMENVYALEDSGASVLIVDAHFSDAAKELMQHGCIRSVIQTEGEPKVKGWLAYEHVVATFAPCEDARRGGEELAGIFYTGGTTGTPKGVMTPHRGLISSALATTPAAGYDDESIMLHVMPMFHIGGPSLTVASTMAGASHVILPRFDPLEVLETIERERITHLLLVPTMLKMLVDHPQIDRFDISSLRYVCYGAASITESQLEAAMEKFPCGFVQFYAQTELSPGCAILESKYHVLSGPYSGHLNSVGRPLGIVELDIIDADGKSLPRGETGEITVSGPMVMLGYWNKPEETAKTLVDGWVRTGDAGYLDEHGFLHVVDRVKDMIISGGENIYSAEVENALAKHPAVAECAVVGVPDPKWGETVLAVVIVREGAEVTVEELIEHCRGLIADYKCPRLVEFRREPFPISGAGKVLKRLIRQEYKTGGAPS